MPHLRSLRNRLAVVFGLIVLGAIATVYLSTVPRLQDRCTQQTLEQLAADAQRQSDVLVYEAQPGHKRKTLGASASDAATRASAEVLVLTPLKGSGPTALSLAVDSSENGGVTGGEVSPIAIEAADSRLPRSVVLNSSVGRQAVAAVPVFDSHKKLLGVAVFADALAD